CPRGPLRRRVRGRRHRPAASGPVRHARVLGGLLRPGLPRRSLRTCERSRPRRPRSELARANGRSAAAFERRPLLHLGGRESRSRPPRLVARVRPGAPGSAPRAPAVAPPRLRARSLLAGDTAVGAALRRREVHAAVDELIRGGPPDLPSAGVGVRRRRRLARLARSGTVAAEETGAAL